MVRNLGRRTRLRTILIYVILATLPCYLLGMIVLWVGHSIKNQATPTPTLEVTTTQSPWEGSPTLTLPPIPTSPAFPTMTPTITLAPSPTPTYVIPSNTPTQSPTPSATATLTGTPTNTSTPVPTDTATSIVVAPTTNP